MTQNDLKGFRFRESTRAPFETEVNLRFDRFGGAVSGYSADISMEGMFVKTKEPKPVGTLVQFEFRLRPDGELIQGLGDVVWVRPRNLGPSKPPGMGVQFRYLDPQSREQIFKIVDKYLKESRSAEPTTAQDPFPGEAPPATPPSPSDAPAGDEPPRLEASSELYVPDDVLSPTAAAAPVVEEERAFAYGDEFGAADDFDAADEYVGGAEAGERTSILRSLLLVVSVLLVLGIAAGIVFRERIVELVARGTGAVQEERGSGLAVPPAPPPETPPEVRETRDEPQGLEATETETTEERASGDAGPALVLLEDIPEVKEETGAPEEDEATGLAGRSFPAPPSAPPVASQVPVLNVARIEGISWAVEGGATVVTVTGDAPIQADGFASFSLAGGQPRFVVAVDGVSEPFEGSRIEVGSPELLRVRTGLHSPSDGGSQIHLVFDLASSGVQATARSDGERLFVRFEGGSR